VCPVSSLTGLAFICDGNPGLTPGAILCRRCATGVQQCSMPTAEILTRPVMCLGVDDVSQLCSTLPHFTQTNNLDALKLPNS